ncbi:MAG: secretin N-terminal domain-containing protein, partial [Planctomycetota bacterium]|nr:secretin N-terminal domain-containing protein [Planctomycetota bacterium]
DLAKVQLSVDSRSDQLVAIARPKHQEIIRETIDRMRTEEQTLEIFQLDVVDPSTATLAIDRLFDSTGYGYDPTAPIVDVDEDSQQLFVSATEEQHEKIRKLLSQMGETNINNVTAQQQHNMRIVPFRGDTRSTIEEIRRLWPRLRDNPLEVVDAEARKIDVKKVDSKNTKEKTEAKNVDEKPKPKAPPKKVKPQAANAKQKLTAKPAGGKDKAKTPKANKTEKPKPAIKPQPKKAQPEKPAKKTPDKSAMRGTGGGTVFRLVGMSTEKKSEKTKTEPKAKPKSKPKPAATAKETTEPKTPADPKTPVLLIVGTNAITVKSDDPEALEQMESLLQSLTPQYAYGRNIGVFPLRNTDAVRLAARLQQVMVQMRPRWQHNQTRTMIVADDRLNAIVVKGPRADRETIESMVRILDAPESPESLRSKQPTLIPVKNTEASRVERVVREVFSAQLAATPRGGPRGSGSSRWSPRVSVDSMSNSLIVVADQALLKQIEDLVETLDTAAGDESARGLKIISLQKANAARVEKALGAAIEKSVRRRRVGR